MPTRRNRARSRFGCVRVAGCSSARRITAEAKPQSSRGTAARCWRRAMSIDCAFHGFLAADADPRTSQAGKQWVRLRVGVGKDDAVQWVSVAVFGKAAETAATLKK